MSAQRPKALYVLLAVLFVGMVFVQQMAAPTYWKIHKSERNVVGGNRTGLMVQLPGQFLIASMTGFKEVVAGALWVRADDFFHTGEYQAIVPIVRMVTWLDPHNIDVFTTGAWHLDYNFTDEQNMSDKRYIPASIGLLKEAIRNNPSIYDLYFELGWTHYNKKLMDYEQGLKYLQMACQRNDYDPNTGEVKPRPAFVDNMLAHQYEIVGRFKDAEAQWLRAKQRVRDLAKNPNKLDFVDEASMDVCDRNLGMLYLRLAYRYGDMDAYRKGVETYKRLASKPNPAPDVVRAYKATSADYARRLATNNPPKDALRPLDTGFDVSWRKVAPMVFLLKGKVNLVSAEEYKNLASEVLTGWYAENQKLPAANRVKWRDGCRVYWRLQDYDYKMPKLDTFDWQIDTSQTVQWDTAYVSGGTFSLQIDLSRQRDFYPFEAKKYKLTIWVDPSVASCPDFIQDRIGWKGEAFADKRYLDTETRPGWKMLRKEVALDRSDIM